MTANDFTFAEDSAGIYLVKKTKTGKFSSDKRLLTEGEAFYIFEHFLKKYCEAHATDEMIVSKNGKHTYKGVLIREEEPVEETLL